MMKTFHSGFFTGIGISIFIAAISFILATLPGFQLIGPLALSILIAVAYRQIAGYPVTGRAGLQFSSKYFLRTAIVLYGLKLNLQVILQDGWHLLILDLLIILFGIFTTYYLARKWNADPKMSLLLGIGTGICGAAAIAAFSPLIQAKEEETATSVGMIALLGTVMGLGYTALYSFSSLSAEQYGVWTGISLHELAHVALASAPGGSDALAIGLLAKLGRVFWLVPLCLLYAAWRNKKTGTTTNTKIDFPWFLIGFIVMSVVGTYLLGETFAQSQWNSILSQITTFLLSVAMVGFGLNVDLKEVWVKAKKTFVILILVSILLSVLSYFLVLSGLLV
ncbi:YeiH family protein [Risungbinella massiliensis]|uniref:YeiH family protein n=1 Tax=Risungbinella massiliensis TaxID=1329796 RepID=UPI000B05368E|nr:putative sulfate exporter family transporter [Risungbinella massiliensis]